MPLRSRAYRSKHRLKAGHRLEVLAAAGGHNAGWIQQGSSPVDERTCHTATRSQVLKGREILENSLGQDGQIVEIKFPASAEGMAPVDKRVFTCQAGGTHFYSCGTTA